MCCTRIKNSCRDVACYVWAFRKRFADVAQLVEHSLGKGEVISSILIIGSRLRRFAGVSAAGARSRNPERC
jgi:hypothetical protein